MELYVNEKSIAIKISSLKFAEDEIPYVDSWYQLLQYINTNSQIVPVYIQKLLLKAHVQVATNLIAFLVISMRKPPSYSLGLTCLFLGGYGCGFTSETITLSLGIGYIKLLVQAETYTKLQHNTFIYNFCLSCPDFPCSYCPVFTIEDTEMRSIRPLIFSEAPLSRHIITCCIFCFLKTCKIWVYHVNLINWLISIINVETIGILTPLYVY